MKPKLSLWLEGKAMHKGGLGAPRQALAALRGRKIPTEERRLWVYKTDHRDHNL